MAPWIRQYSLVLHQNGQRLHVRPYTSEARWNRTFSFDYTPEGETNMDKKKVMKEILAAVGHYLTTAHSDKETIDWIKAIVQRINDGEFDK